MTNACRFPRRLAPRSARQRGIAALALTMVMLVAMVLGIGFLNRNLVFEQRASANQYRSTQAFEAAEAGLEWAVAQIDHPQRIGDDCLPTTDLAQTSFRSRHLAFDVAGAGYTSTTWADGGVARALQPTCIRIDGGWACSCPTAGAPSLAPVASPAPSPAFMVQFQPAAQPGLIRVVATGCTSLGGACLPAAGTAVDATAQVQVLLALMPALRTPPAAALTVRGSVLADAAGLGAHNRHAAAGGLAIHAGGAVMASSARMTAVAGGATTPVIAASDTALAALTPNRLFASYFGIDRTGWAAQPGAHRLACPSDCTATLLGAIASDDDASLLYIEGDALISGPATLGSRTHPVVIVSSGALRLAGAVTVNGLLYGGSVTWTGASSTGARVIGAVISESDYQGDGTPDIDYDAAVLSRLQHRAGTFARVNGSWRDF